MVWLRRLFALHAGRRPDHAPFFVARDRVRPLRARDALTDLRTVLARVCGETQANTYGCHGCRVEGYDKTRRVNKPLAIAQGGWDPEAGSNERYDRFSQSEVHDIPSDIYRQLQADASPLQAVSADSDVAVPSPDAPQEPAERQLVRRPPADGRGRLGSARRPAPAPASASASQPPPSLWVKCPRLGTFPRPRGLLLLHRCALPGQTGVSAFACSGQTWTSGTQVLSPLTAAPSRECCTTRRTAGHRSVFIMNSQLSAGSSSMADAFPCVGTAQSLYSFWGYPFGPAVCRTLGLAVVAS